MIEEPTPNTPVPQPPPERKPVPERFQVARGTLFFDRFMTVAIQGGGIAIILAVFAIFFFIGWEVLPLFRGAQVHHEVKVEVPPEVREATVLAVDDWAKLPMLYAGGPDLTFIQIGEKGSEGVTKVPLGLPEGVDVSSVTYYQAKQRLVLGTALGQFAVADIIYNTGATSASAKVKLFMEPTSIGQPNAAIRDIALGDAGDKKIVAAVQQDGVNWRLYAVTFKQKRGLMGSGKLQKDKEYDLSSQLSAKPVHLLASANGDSLLVAEENGEIAYFFLDGDEFKLRQRFKPFDKSKDRSVASMHYLYGDVSISLTNGLGENVVYSLFRPKDGDDTRIFGKTKTFPKLEGGADFYASSLRNRAFVIGHANQATILYGTTESVRWKKKLDYDVRLAAFDPKYEHLAFLGKDGALRLMGLHDPHPEAGMKAFFGKVWYEGASEPAYAWQSTSGNDDFEPKLSQIPLIVGTLKGTFYAMLFSIPIALMAAVYVSNFMQPSYKKVIKPTMEIMASLPSVVLGFMAALWLAPIMEQRVPSVLLLIVGLPLITALFGWFWTRQPVSLRAKLRPGREFFLLMPVMLLSGWILWSLGPVIESMFFVVKDPATGERIADFRLWWPTVTGTPYNQRNSLVVGFMMGFAVIPIIFTIAEDALSNVPASLTAASAALGASRWQTVRHVVLPIASAGIFSALMIGLGRAVGETMIMVMSTGNTAVMEGNPFSGMRTLAANIAVELPEAAAGSTHYRTLFLGALVLFLFTFTINTIAELLRQHLREKFKIV